MLGDRLTLGVEDEEPRAGCAIVDSPHECFVALQKSENTHVVASLDIPWWVGDLELLLSGFCTCFLKLSEVDTVRKVEEDEEKKSRRDESNVVSQVVHKEASSIRCFWCEYDGICQWRGVTW